MEQIFAPYPNTVFRFRSYSPLSLKELQYGELFFASKDELNDPYDTKNLSLFEGNKEIYKRLINYTLTPKNAGAAPLENWKEIVDVDEVAEYLSKENVLYDGLIEKLNTHEFEDVVINAFSKNNIPESIGASQIFIKFFKYFIHAYSGGHTYIASFSKKCDNPLMWSHYTNHHKGFCLCFNIKDGMFVQKNDPKKSYLFKSYPFENVSYKTSNVTTNGFCRFPRAIYDNDNFNEKEYWNLWKQSYLTKFENWKYEEEIRLVHNELIANATDNGNIKKSIVDRIFYYDQTQLTGIIFGSRMGKIEQEEIKNIIYKTRENQQLINDCRPIFQFYQAKESINSFEMEIKLLIALDTHNKYFNVDELEAKQKEYEAIKTHYLRNKQEVIN